MKFSVDRISAVIPGAECLSLINKAALVQPSRAGDATLSYLVGAAPALREIIDKQGVLFLRGFSMPDTQAFSAVMKALGFDLDNTYSGGAAPRASLSEAIWTSTQVADPLIIAYHTEMCYSMSRPRYLGFHCLTPPRGAGETVLFDAAGTFDDLPAAMRDKAVSLGVRYQRYFPHRRKFGMPNFYVTWSDAFNNTDKSAVEVELSAQQIEWVWSDEGLVTWQTLPAVVASPRDGSLCFNAAMYDDYSNSYNLAMFKSRYGFLTYHALQWFARRQVASSISFLSTLWGDGSKFSEDESHAIQRAAWRNSGLVNWHAGDVIVFDNISMAHGRMNVKKPRLIAAALADMYNVRELREKQQGRAALAHPA